MTDKTFDHEEHARERLRQTTPGAGEGKRWIAGGETDMRQWAGRGYRVYADSDGHTVAVTQSLEERDLICKLHNAREADQQTIADLTDKLSRWHDAMTDVSVINWTLSEDNAEDLHKQLMAVIAMAVQEATDPVVSQQAQTIAELREALAGLAHEFANWYRPEGAKPSGWLWADDWLEKYDRLTTQAPEAGQ